MRAHTVVHLDAGELDAAKLLRCDHEDGRVSFRLVDSSVQVWLTGTTDDLLRFARDLDDLAERADEVPS